MSRLVLALLLLCQAGCALWPLPPPRMKPPRGVEVCEVVGGRVTKCVEKS